MHYTLWSLLFLVTAGSDQSDAKPYVRDRKYSKNPGGGACANDRYRCEEGSKCIPIKWICDGVNDCDDKLDERNCFSANKTSNLPYISSQQIAEAQRILDPRSSLVNKCLAFMRYGDIPCAKRRVSYKNGRAITCCKFLALSPTSMAATQQVTETGCPKNTYSCDEGDRCLLLSSLCDGISDCQDGSDEKNCPVNSACKSNKFSCDEGIKCIPLTWVCDSINDCNDNKDEHNCPGRKGKSMARVAEEVAITAAQEAKRAAEAAQELMRKAKEAADKARLALKIAEGGKQKKI